MFVELVIELAVSVLQNSGPQLSRPRLSTHTHFVVLVETSRMSAVCPLAPVTERGTDDTLFVPPNAAVSAVRLPASENPEPGGKVMVGACRPPAESTHTTGVPFKSTSSKS